MAEKSSDQNLRVDEELRMKLPTGVKLVRTLRGHTEVIGRIAWSPDGHMLASPSGTTAYIWNADTGNLLRKLDAHSWIPSVAFDPTGHTLASAGAIKLWDPFSGELLRNLEGQRTTVYGVAFDATGRALATAAWDKTLKLSDQANGKLLHTLQGHQRWISTVAFDPLGRTLASGSEDSTIKLWDPASGKLLRTLRAHDGGVYGIAFDRAGRTMASGGLDKTVKLWDPVTGKLLRTLEGHTGGVTSVDFLSDDRLIASKSFDGTIRLWNSLTGATLCTLEEPSSEKWLSSVAFHRSQPLLATVGSDPNSPLDERDRVIHIWELDVALLLGKVGEPSAHYVNAKVVLVGDTGVGKSGLSLVLNKQPYRETDSTLGRHVWSFDSNEVAIGANVRQSRETLLWDLAGQPGYRIIHQLHLNEVAVALVVFDARSETDPLAGVRHWERALRLAQQRQGTACVPMKKLLVSARNDRGGVSVSKERLEALKAEFEFDNYFETSAKEGWGIKRLRAAIEQSIVWEELPEVSSSQLFADIKSFLLKVKQTGRLLAPATELYDEFALLHPDKATSVANLQDQFHTCVGRLENRDLIRRLTFGRYVLLQPELLDAYASAMVNAAKEEPDGLGSFAEESALGGRLFVPKEQKIVDPPQEQLLLHATVEELVRHDLALRENANDGRYLVFPSQFNREYEDAPEPKGKAVAITFDGPVQSLYSTLVVRLGHSGLFTTGRAEMWRNASVFTAKAGGKCGLFLHEFAEARGRLILFYDEQATPETRFHFEEFVLAHATRRSLDGSIELIRYFVCSNGHPVPYDYVNLLRAQGKKKFRCPCGVVVALAEPKERIRFSSQVYAMDRSADRQRDFDAFVVSAKGETSTKSFQEWAGGEVVTLAIVFTDVLASTALGERIREEEMNEVRRAHFGQTRKLIARHQGREIKTIGDSFMAAFKSSNSALDFARALQETTGHPLVQVRAGIHIGPMHIEKGDVFGGTVNFAARVVGAIKGAEIWTSDRAKEDIDRLGAKRHQPLEWQLHDDVEMRGFSGKFRLWSMKERRGIDPTS